METTAICYLPICVCTIVTTEFLFWLCEKCIAPLAPLWISRRLLMAQDVMGTLGIYTFVIKVIGVSVRSVMVSVTRCTMKVFFCCAYEAKAGLEWAFVFFQNKSMVVERKHEHFPLDYDAHSKVLSLFPGWNSCQEVFYFRVVNECVKDTSSQLFLSPFLQNIMLSLFVSANNRCVTLLLTSGGGGDAGGWHFNILC